MQQSFVPLRVHGHHSLLVGVDGPAAIWQAAQGLQLPAVALCDLDSVAGVVDFLQAAEGATEAAPRPIVGAEISDPTGRPGRVVALVQSEAGWANLCKLVSARQLGSDPGQDVDVGPFDLVDAVQRHADGLVFLVDHPRLILGLAGRLGDQQLWAALPLAPDGMARVRGFDGGWDLIEDADAVDQDQLDFMKAGKCVSPARPTADLVAALIGTARANRVGLVAAPDVWYVDSDGAELQRVRAAVRGNALLERVPDQWLAADGAGLIGAGQVRAAYLEYGQALLDPGALDTSIEDPSLPSVGPNPATLSKQIQAAVDQLITASAQIADSCVYTPPLGGVIFPEVDCGATGSPYSELARLSFEGAARRYQPMTPAVIARLEMELSAINDLGFAAYFLLVHQIAGFAKDSGIPCVGRGSAADSLVAYCLELTDADPLRYRLPFERFLNPTRADRPDIDLDFCWRRRDEVLDAVYTTFGPTRTAMISTLGCFGLRSAFREAALVVGLPPAEFERWSKRLPWSPPPKEAWRAPPKGLDQLAENPVAQAFAVMPECRHFPFDDKRFVAALEAAGSLLDVPRQMGLHPGGVVVAPHSITDHTACARAAKGPVVTQFDKDAIEALGLVKMDLLGNRALTVIDDCLISLRQEHAIEIDLEALAEDDPLTADLLREGRAIGCFQIESPGMRHLLQQIEARTMDDVIQAIALIRPGPAGSGMKDAFIRRFRGLEPPTPPHPLLKEVLADTHGVMLYQEDVMQVAAALAGMSLGEADRLRRALSKRRSKDLDDLAAIFKAGAKAKGVSDKDAAHVWELIANFAAFGFCKAHAVTYGRISYRAAWLKAHHPVAYMTAFLASHTGYYGTRVYIEEARRMGATILGPDVNQSTDDFSFVPGKSSAPDAIRAGLNAIKGLSTTTIERMLAARESGAAFLSLPDLKERSGADRGELEAMIRTGALDAFDRTRPELLWRLHLLSAPPKRAPKLPPGQAQLNHLELESLRSTPATRAAEQANTGWGGNAGRVTASFVQEEPQSLLAFQPKQLHAPALPALPAPLPTENAIEELEWLGFTTRLHPVNLFADELPPHTGPITPCREVANMAGQSITIRGWLAASRRHRGDDGRWMSFLTLEDESGLTEAALFADAYDRWAATISGPGPYLITGTAQDQMGAVTLHVERVQA